MPTPDTPWDRERIQACEETRLIEREDALRDIILLMHRHEISAAEVELHIQRFDLRH